MLNYTIFLVSVLFCGLASSGNSLEYRDFLNKTIKSGPFSHKEIMSTCLSSIDDCFSKIDAEIGPSDPNAVKLDDAFMSIHDVKEVKGTLLDQIVSIIKDSTDSSKRKHSLLTLPDGRQVTLLEFAKDKEIMRRGMEALVKKGRSEGDRKADSIITSWLTALWSAPTESEWTKWDISVRQQKIGLLESLKRALSIQQTHGSDLFVDHDLIDRVWRSPSAPNNSVPIDWGSEKTVFLHLQALLLKAGTELANASGVDPRPFERGIRNAESDHPAEDCSANLWCALGYISAIDLNRFQSSQDYLLPHLRSQVDEAISSVEKERLLARKVRNAVNSLSAELKAIQV